MKMPTRGGMAFFVREGDLPAETRAALVAGEHGVEPDAADPSLWGHFATATPKARTEAERRLEAAIKVGELIEGGATRGAAIDKAAAESGASASSVRRWLAKVEGVDFQNWLATLAPGHSREGRKAEIDPEMWKLFLGFIDKSGPTMGIRHAWRTTRALAEVTGAAWPSYDAVLARWNDLPAQERALLQHGAKARDALIPHQTRSVAHLHAMEIVNLDGRYADVFAEWEDGTISRPIVLTAQDVHTRKILGRVYTKTENSDDIKELVLQLCDRWGIPDRILCDNGRGFMAKKMAAGTGRRFRWNVDNGTLGLFAKAGIKLMVAKPYNGRAKPIERHFREDARDIDAGPEFSGAHCGGRPDAKPEDFTGEAVPIATFVAVYEAATAEQNARPGRRTEMCGGVKSFDQAFDESRHQRPRRVLTLQQRLYLSRDEVLRTPDRDGGIRLLGHRYLPDRAGDHDALLKHTGKPVRVLYDPSNLTAGVRVETLQGSVVVAELPRHKAGPFDSTEDARDHARAGAALKKGVKLQERATHAQVLAALGRKKPAPAVPEAAAAPVIHGNFSPAARAQKPAEGSMSPEDFRKFVLLGDERTKRDREAAELASWRERGGAPTPPAQSTTQAEACSTRTKTA